MNRIKSPIRAYIRCSHEIASKFLFASGNEMYTVIDEFDHWEEVYAEYQSEIEVLFFEHLAVNTKYPLVKHNDDKYRVEYGAIIREGVELGEDCIVLMGAVINTGVKIGKYTMIDMNAVIGSNAVVGEKCHIAAGAILAGTMEPYGEIPVCIGDNVFVGANAIVMEGIQIEEGSIIGAGTVVTRNIPKGKVVYGNPSRIIRDANENDYIKMGLNWKLRKQINKL